MAGRREGRASVQPEVEHGKGRVAPVDALGEVVGVQARAAVVEVRDDEGRAREKGDAAGTDVALTVDVREPVAAVDAQHKVGHARGAAQHTVATDHREDELDVDVGVVEGRKLRAGPRRLAPAAAPADGEEAVQRDKRRATAPPAGGLRALRADPGHSSR